MAETTTQLDRSSAALVALQVRVLLQTWMEKMQTSEEHQLWQTSAPKKMCHTQLLAHGLRSTSTEAHTEGHQGTSREAARKNTTFERTEDRGCDSVGFFFSPTVPPDPQRTSPAEETDEELSVSSSVLAPSSASGSDYPRLF